MKSLDLMTLYCISSKLTANSRTHYFPPIHPPTNIFVDGWGLPPFSGMGDEEDVDRRRVELRSLCGGDKPSILDRGVREIWRDDSLLTYPPSCTIKA